NLPPKNKHSCLHYDNFGLNYEDTSRHYVQKRCLFLGVYGNLRGSYWYYNNCIFFLLYIQYSIINAYYIKTYFYYGFSSDLLQYDMIIIARVSIKTLGQR